MLKFYIFINFAKVRGIHVRMYVHTNVGKVQSTTLMRLG